MDLPDLLFDKHYIREQLKFQGAGGQEKLLLKMFASPDARRDNGRHHDFVVQGHKIETKRQRKTNWFDYGKYHNIDEETGNIIMLFVMHDGCRTTCIAGITLRSLLKLVCNDSQCRSFGWTPEAMRMAHQLKTEFPALEHKAKLHMDKLLQQYSQHFRIYWRRSM